MIATLPSLRTSDFSLQLFLRGNAAWLNKFPNYYFNALCNVDLPIDLGQMNARVIYFETSFPFMVNSSNKKHLIKHTAGRRGFLIKRLNDGVDTVTVSKSGCQTQTFSINCNGPYSLTMKLKE